VENNCILSKDADITVCFEVRSSELTVASSEYEAIHSAWHKAIKETLPDYTVNSGLVHKENHAMPDIGCDDGFELLGKSHQQHLMNVLS
jgi:hypothetical protein